MDGIWTDVTTPVQSGPDSNGNEGVLQIFRSSKTGASTQDEV